MGAPLDAVNGNPVFDAEPSPTVVLDTDFQIRAANRAYLAVSGRSRDELVGVNIFEAFPDNPEDPDVDGTTKLRQSLETVVRTGRLHHMLVQRYDITDPATGQWTRRYWTPVNAPVHDGVRVVGVVHRVDDITPLHARLDQVLDRYDALLRAGRVTEEDAAAFVDAAAGMVASAKEHRRLVDEVTNLRLALTSRATIDQAKGIIMAERRCGPDEAFRLLVRLSNDTNVTVANVAAALVYNAEGSRAHSA